MYIHKIGIYGETVCIYTTWKQFKNDKIYRTGHFSTTFYNKELYNYVKKNHNVDFTIEYPFDKFLVSFMEEHLRQLEPLKI